MTTEQLRENFLVQNLVQDDTVQLVYSHYDRVIIGGVKPVNKTIALPNHPELKADYFFTKKGIGYHQCRRRRNSSGRRKRICDQ